MRALVTGGGGFIGSHLCEALKHRGYDVRALVRYNSRGLWGWLEDSPCKDEIEIEAGDIRNLDIVKRALRGVDVVFHLAALIGIPFSYVSPDSYVDTNVRGTMNVLQASVEAGVSKIIHTSTSEVYGTAQFTPITEDHPLNPQSPYAASKLGADFLALSFYRSFNTPIAVMRPFNTYGPRQSARAIIPTIISQIAAGRRRIKLGSLSPTRDLTFVTDTIAAFIAVADSEKSVGEVINVGSGFEISIGDLAQMISRLMNVEIDIESTDARVRPGKSEVQRLIADARKARTLSEWAPRCSLEAGLVETISWIKANIHSYKPDIYNI